jgi:hypothetical protein
VLRRWWQSPPSPFPSLEQPGVRVAGTTTMPVGKGSVKTGGSERLGVEEVDLRGGAEVEVMRGQRTSSARRSRRIWLEGRSIAHGSAGSFTKGGFASRRGGPGGRVV